MLFSLHLIITDHGIVKIRNIVVSRRQYHALIQLKPMMLISDALWQHHIWLSGDNILRMSNVWPLMLDTVIHGYRDGQRCGRQMVHRWQLLGIDRPEIQHIQLHR
ncbi:unnamed protein product [Haemonchus placei]|uniref:Secreted protein n=1 Tax=Haemonchus placei TaxID=6290 RepID=A0A0N4X5B8_HAEPC|nr:unnamed protein product [Haemonchus placei]